MQPVNPQPQSKFWKYSYPVISILLGLFVGIYAFQNYSPKGEKFPAERIYQPAIWGLTTTYLVLSVGVNLRIKRDRKAKQKPLKF